MSGRWKGIFHYPRLLPPGQFDAQLRDQMGRISGETSEISNEGPDCGLTLHAWVEGARQGKSVHFTKTYDDLKRAIDPVLYSGDLNEDGNEISGRWSIADDWSGTFLMIRAAPNSAASKIKAAETVR